MFAAENGRHALSIASAVPPDLVLCDLSMPVMDGYQFVREFRARDHGRHIPVLAVSALAVESADLVGFDGYVSKPIDLAVLEARIAAIRADVARAAERATAALDRAEAACSRVIAASEDVVARMLRTKKRIEK